MAITEKDIDKLSEVFATKYEFSRLREEMKTRFDQVTTNLDWLMGKVQLILDELTVRFEHYRRHDDRLENHEKRIKAVEEKVLVP